MAVNSSEELVELICRRSFLSLWSTSNPQGKDASKELCDVLIVCDPHVVVVSVKSIALKRTEDPAHGYARWRRKAIDDSAAQLGGACRWLEGADSVVRSDGSKGLRLPPRERRIVHRVAVAFGGEGEVAHSSGDMHGGFVHVFTEETFESILAELDTVIDLTDYLAAKERLLERANGVLIVGTERDLLAMYLLQNRSFPEDDALLIIGDDTWEGFSGRDDLARRKAADRVSYFWDGLVERLSGSVVDGWLGPGGDFDDAELALRQMAKEPRFSRRLLSMKLRDFIEERNRRKIRARVVPSRFEGVVYVFLNTLDEEDREATFRELSGRCYMVRGLYPGARIVVGVAFEWRSDRTFVMMLYRFEPKEWTSKDQAKAREGVEITGWFKTAEWYRIRADEYPSA